jgi:hypothetical protein
MKKTFIIEPIEMDFVLISKDAVEFQIWKGNDVVMGSSLDEFNDVTKLGLIVPVGSVNFVNGIYKIITNESLVVDNWPTDIRKWVIQKEYGECSIGDLPFFPVFIKPKYDTKLFSGELIASRKSIETLQQMIFDSTGMTLDNTDVVYWSEPINFIAEWRAIMFEGKLLSFSPYDSNRNHYETLYLRMADAFSFANHICSHVDSSIARIVDIGLDIDGNFGVVECANHITTAATYSTFIDRDRWYNALCSTGIQYASDIVNTRS